MISFFQQSPGSSSLQFYSTTYFDDQQCSDPSSSSSPSPSWLLLPRTPTTVTKMDVNELCRTNGERVKNSVKGISAANLPLPRSSKQLLRVPNQASRPSPSPGSRTCHRLWLPSPAANLLMSPNTSLTPVNTRSQATSVLVAVSEPPERPSTTQLLLLPLLSSRSFHPQPQRSTSSVTSTLRRVCRMRERSPGRLRFRL